MIEGVKAVNGTKPGPPLRTVLLDIYKVTLFLQPFCLCCSPAMKIALIFYSTICHNEVQIAVNYEKMYILSYVLRFLECAREICTPLEKIGLVKYTMGNDDKKLQHCFSFLY